MRYFILFFIITSTLFAQPNTEVYLFDITAKDSVKLKNRINISSNEGYDSQPYFVDNNLLLYSGTRKGQTEIISYLNGVTAQMNAFTTGGEYSPQLIPGTNDISAVRLDTSGYQRLYRYPLNKTASSELIKDAVVAYYTWADKSTIVAANIVNQKLHLVIHNLKTQTNEDLEIEVGRSFHKIPNSNLVSFIDKSEKQWFVKSIDPISKEIKPIAPLLPGSEDICWLPDGSLLLSKDNTLFKFDKHAPRWQVFHSFSDSDLKSISRIASSPDGKKFAVVSANSKK